MKIYETLADIAYAAGLKGYYSGDSRADIQLFIRLAEKFEKKYAKTEFGIDDAPDYMDTIEKFIILHFKHAPVRKLSFVPAAAKDKWDNIEIEGCAIVDDDGSVERVDSNPDFYSVYLHQVRGGVQCIADLPTEKLAMQLYSLLKNAVKSYKENGFLYKKDTPEQKFRDKVNAIMEKDYLLTSNNFYLSEEMIKQCITAKEKPRDWCEQYATKRDLDKVS